MYNVPSSNDHDFTIHSIKSGEKQERKVGQAGLFSSIWVCSYILYSHVQFLDFPCQLAGELRSDGAYF